jgi:hypothetical protein
LAKPARHEPETTKTMKNPIHTLAAATLVAAFATATAHAESRIVNQGRAGYQVAPKTEQRNTGARSATVVALAVQKPQQGPTRIHAAGRAGYVVVPNTMNR